MTRDATIPGDTRCVPSARAQQLIAQPTVTPGMVLKAFRRVPLPRTASIAQPGDKTLINFDTIFHADAPALRRTVTLLGQEVRLDIRARRFDWSWGDGLAESTTSGGAAYPSKEIVHRYHQAHVTVHHAVTVVWEATYSVNGGASQPVPGTVSMSGPSTALRVSEATPALSGAGH